jgi:hypothetical protein
LSLARCPLAVSLVDEQRRQHDRIPHDEPFRKPDTRKCAELRVTALDELLKSRRREPRVDGVRVGRTELRRVTRQRPPLALVDVGDIDDERRRGRVVDEVVADARRLPRNAERRLEAAESAAECRLGQQLATCRAIVPAIPISRSSGCGPKTRRSTVSTTVII